MTERRQAEKTSFILGRETASTSPLKAITDLVEIRKIDGKPPSQTTYRRYVVTAWNHDENSEKQSSNALRAGRADVFGEDGFLWGDGTIEIEIPSEEGFLDILQGVLGDPKPVSTAVPTKRCIVAETYADVKADGFFTAEAAIDHTVAALEDISNGNSDVPVFDNLASYPSLALQVTGKLSNSPTVSNAGGQARIDYTDINGEVQRATLTFPKNSEGDAQQATLPAGAVLTTIGTRRIQSGNIDITVSVAANLARNPDPDAPGRLRFTIGTADADGGKVVVCGVRKVGLATSDTLPLQEEIPVADKAGIAENYFHKIDAIEILKSDGAPLDDSVTVDIQSEPGGYATVLQTVNDEFQGWTLEPEIGGEPWLITRAVPIGAEIEVGETIGATIDLLSNRVDKRKTIGGGVKDDFIPTPQKTENADKFAFIGRRFFSGYGRYLVIDGEAVICDSAPISIVHNYDFAQGELPGRFRRGTEPTARRNVTSSVQTKYRSGTSEEDVFLKWDEKFRNNEPVSAKIVMYQWLGNGRQLAIIYEMVNCEIVSPVRVPVTGPGAIPVTVELKAVPPEDEVAGELKVTIVGDDQWT